MVTTGERHRADLQRLDLLVSAVAGADVPSLARGSTLVACALAGRGEWSAAERMIVRAERALGWRP